jgi:hypothetical protein
VTFSAVRPGYPPAPIPPYRSLRCIGSPLQIPAGDRRPSTWIPSSSNTLIPPAVDISISPVQYIGAPSQIPAHGRPVWARRRTVRLHTIIVDYYQSRQLLTCHRRLSPQPTTIIVTITADDNHNRLPPQPTTTTVDYHHSRPPSQSTTTTADYYHSRPPSKSTTIPVDKTSE